MVQKRSLINIPKKGGFVLLCFGSKSKIIREPIACNQEPVLTGCLAIRVAESHSGPRVNLTKAKTVFKRDGHTGQGHPRRGQALLKLTAKQKPRNRKGPGSLLPSS